MSREYNWEFPLNIPSFYMSTFVDKVVQSGLWQELPVALINKLDAAYKARQGVGITKADLDTIPDKEWAKVLKVIG